MLIVRCRTPLALLALCALSASAADAFACDKGQTLISPWQVNDNYCDCKDGSDEPKTSACLNGHFYCANTGYVGKYVPSSRVDDGVCDCCDGSDETRIKCPNTCAQLMESELVRQREKQAKLQAGLGKLAELKEKAQQKLTDLRSASAAAKEKLSALVDDVETAREKRDGAKEDRDAAVEKESDTVRAYTEAFTKALGEYLSSNSTLANALRDHQTFTSMMEERASRMANSSWSEEDENAFRAGSDAREAAAKIAAWWNEAKNATIDALDSMASYVLARDSARKERTAADVAVGDAESEVQKAEEQERQTRDDSEAYDRVASSTSWGQNHVLYAMKDECASLPVDGHSYEVCIGAEARQDGAHSLGRFDHWESDGNVAVYQGGSSCWQGPARSLRARFECGAELKVTHVDEPEKCTYTAVVESPSHCFATKTSSLNHMHHVFHSDEL